MKPTKSRESRVRAIGQKEAYIRFTPTFGISIILNKKYLLKWSRSTGWYRERRR